MIGVPRATCHSVGVLELCTPSETELCIGIEELRWSAPTCALLHNRAHLEAALGLLVGLLLLGLLLEPLDVACAVVRTVVADAREGACTSRSFWEAILDQGQRWMGDESELGAVAPPCVVPPVYANRTLVYTHTLLAETNQSYKVLPWLTLVALRQTPPDRHPQSKPCAAHEIARMQVCWCHITGRAHHGLSADALPSLHAQAMSPLVRTRRPTSRSRHLRAVP